MERTDEPGRGGDPGSLSIPDIDAEAIAEVLARSGRDWCWFDGSAAPAGEARVSLLGVAASTRVCEPGAEAGFLPSLAPAPPMGRRAGGPEARFASGWVVALAYEFGVSLLRTESAPRAVSLSASAPGDPSALALRLDAVIAVDHDLGTCELRGDPRAFPEMLGIVAAARAAGRAADPSPAMRRAPAWRRSDDEYRAAVEACKEAIHAGDSYVLCLTDTVEATGEFSPLDLYLRLRAAGAATRGGLIVTSHLALVSASPERFLSVHGDRLATHPIKGTRPRGADAVEDAESAARLAADPKERAENLMIVDLMRNDLSRVCDPGTVAVEGFLRVESHPHVHQLVSTVEGRLMPGRGIRDAVAVCFPGGSMTGAPKRRAVEILAALEGAPRGLYAGCFGWIDDGGDAELAMTIRSVELHAADDRVYRRALVGAGGGITADSDPSREVAEKHLKASSVVAALYP